MIIVRIPSQTIEVARQAFSKRTLYLKLRDSLGIIYNNQQFASFIHYATRGQSAYSPGQLERGTVIHFLEGLTAAKHQKQCVPGLAENACWV